MCAGRAACSPCRCVLASCRRSSALRRPASLPALASASASPPPQSLCDQGFSASDIISILFRVVRSMPAMNEYVKLEYIKQIGFSHMRIGDGVASRLQLSGLLAELCALTLKAAG